MELRRASLRIDSFSKLRTSSSLCSEFMSKLAKTALFVIPSSARNLREAIQCSMHGIAAIRLNRDTPAFSRFKQIFALINIFATLRVDSSRRSE